MNRRSCSLCAALAAALLAACASPAPSVRVAPHFAAPERGLDRRRRRARRGEGRARDRARRARSRTGGSPRSRRPGRARRRRERSCSPGKGATLVPGLVDMHGHVYANSNPIWVGGLPDPEANLRTYLYSGVTTVFDPGRQQQRRVRAPRRASRAASWSARTSTPRGRSTPRPKVTRSRSCASSRPGGSAGTSRRASRWRWTRWRRRTRRSTASREQRPDAVKIVIDEIPLGAPRMRPEVARAIADRARSHGLRTVAHIGTTRDAIIAAESGVALWVHGVYKERIPDAEIACSRAIASRWSRRSRCSTAMRGCAAAARGDPARARDGARGAARLLLSDARGIRCGIAHVVAGSERAGDGGAHRERAPAARGRRHDLRGQRHAIGCLPGPGPAPRAREPRRAPASRRSKRSARRRSTRRASSPSSDAPDWGNVAVGQRADLLLVEGDPTRDVAALSAIRAVLLDGVPIERTPVENPPS